MLGWLATLSRYGLFKETLRVFLQALRKHYPGHYEQIQPELSRDDLQDEFDLTEKDPEKIHRRITEMARDLYRVKMAFEQHAKIKRFTTLQTLLAVFEQQVKRSHGLQTAINPHQNQMRVNPQTNSHKTTKRSELIHSPRPNNGRLTWPVPAAVGGRAQDFTAFRKQDRPYDLADFEVSFPVESEALAVLSCPEKHKPLDQKSSDKTGRILVNFEQATCAQCPTQDRCPIKIGVQVATLDVSEQQYDVGAQRHHLHRGDAQYRKRCGTRITLTIPVACLL